MVRYWIIAPYRSTKQKIFDEVWKYDLEHGTIAVGWRDIGDITNIKSIDELRKKYIKTYPDETNNSTITKDCNALWNFHNEISSGDIIIARQGRKKVLAIGTVKRPKQSYYKEDKGKERVGDLTDHYYPNFIEVNWDEKNIKYDKQVFSMYTIYEINENRFDEIIKGKKPELEEETDDEREQLFLEKHLQEVIVNNFDTIFKRKLTIFVDKEGNTGDDYSLIGNSNKEIGRIDILAKDPSTNDFVVIELKKGRTAGKVIGQTLEYMGWVKNNLCQNDEKVRGLIICKEEDERLSNAQKMIEDLIDIKFYDLNLKLKD